MIAKKYSTALYEVFSEGKLEELIGILSVFVDGEISTKLQDIIKAPYLNFDEKAKVLQSCMEAIKGDIDDKSKTKILNFLRILIDNKRFEILGEIVRELKAMQCRLSNTFDAKIFSSTALDDVLIASIKQKIEEKLKIKLNLENVITKIEGIRLNVEVLELEISVLKTNILREIEAKVLQLI